MANVTTQVIERHIVRNLQLIFSPSVVNGMADSQVESITSESATVKRQRLFLDNRIAKLKEGQEIFRSIVGSTF